MKVEKKSLLQKMIKNLIFVFLLNLIFVFHCDTSISKLTIDVLKDFENYKTANLLNSTHFSCDNGERILDIEKFNDDFCDCKDGSDENSNSFFLLFE